MYLGVDYYPEHWDKDRWQKDAKEMRDIGLKAVRIGEFTWSKIEPEEGEYNFSWLDEVVNILADYNIYTVMCTPTASPPPWMVTKHPDILPVDSERRRKYHGSRRHYCPNNPTYRSYSRQITSKLGEHFGQLDWVIGWQLDNEIGNHDTARCYCEICTNRFRDWLRGKYGSLEALNKAWGTIFWGQEYRNWEEVPLPWNSPVTHNPSFLLDFYRFCSDSNTEYLQVQIDALKKKISKQFITTNLMGSFYEIDYFKLAENLDFVSWDNYPEHVPIHAETRYSEAALAHDIMRGLKAKNFWVTEQQCNRLTRKTVTPAMRPGDTKIWTYQAFAHGADAVLYFRWRACRFGTEQYHGGLLGHDGTPSIPSYKEVREIAEEVRKIGDKLSGSEIKAEVAIVLSYDDYWALKTYPLSEGFNYELHLFKYYKALFDLNVPVDIIKPTSDFSKYKIVIAPTLLMVDAKIKKNLYEYVKQGGTLIAGFRTGIKDYNNVITDKTFPGELAELFGIEVNDYDSPPAEVENEVVTIDPDFQRGTYKASTWYDIIDTKEAKTIAVYRKDYYATKAAVSIKDHGQGKAVYVGTEMEPTFYRDFFETLLHQLEIGYFTTPDGVTAFSREKEDKTFMFLLNHNDEYTEVMLKERHIDLLTGKEKSGLLSMKPKEIMVLERD